MPLTNRVVEVIDTQATEMNLVAPVQRWQICLHSRFKDRCSCWRNGISLPKHPEEFAAEVADHFHVIIHYTDEQIIHLEQSARRIEESVRSSFSLLQTQVTKLPAQTTQLQENCDPCEDQELGFMMKAAFSVRDGPAQIELADRKVPLCLEAVIPDTRKERGQSEVSFQLFDRRNWYHQCATGCSIPVGELPDGLKVKKTTYQALTAHTQIDFRSCHWMLFIDGSANDVSAAWSVVVVATDGVQQQFIGCTYGVVHTSPEHELWFGAESVTNISAEFVALTVAQNLVLQWNDNAKYWICPDLMLSKLLAQKAVVPRVNPKQTHIIRLQAEWIEDRCEYHHVKGHDGFAWNELADSLASYALKENVDAENISVQPLQALLKSPEDLEWVWMQDPTDPIAACFPHLQEEMAVTVDLSLKTLTAKPPKFEEVQTQATFALLCVSANVLALDSRTETREIGRNNGPRTARLDAQWHEAGVQLIGLQETRTEEGSTQSDHYRILASGADFSHTATHGVELWYHKSLAIITDQAGSNQRLVDAPVTVQFADPRRLFVQFGLKPVPFSAVVLHVPCLKQQQDGRQAALESLQQWWHDTLKMVQKYVCLQFCVFFIDANAPLGFNESLHVGSCGAEGENAQGLMFEEFLITAQLCIPATFHEFHWGQSTTWTHPRGTSLRRDYIATALDMKLWTKWTCVVRDHDNVFAHEDHLPVMLSMSGWIETSDPARKIIWDETKFKDPIRCQQFREALRTLPLPSWEISVDDHASWYEAQLLELARMYFEKTSKSRTRPTLAPDTLELIQFKRSCLDYGRATRSMQDPDFRTELKTY